MAVAALAAAAAILPTAAGAAVGDIGYEDHSYAGASGGISGEKPESKLWWNDGIWWASLFDGVSGDYHIFRLDTATQTWTDTGVALDTRPASRADVLWDGSKLYVASHIFSTSSTTAAGPSYLYRFSYNAATKTYTRDPGFPTTINNAKTETLVIEKDSTGQLWATWTQGNPRQVYVNRTSGGDASWGTPYVIPVAGTTVSTDDISSLISFGGKIGVMWSNQSASAMYFAVHDDAAADTTWEASRTAIQGPGNADDHINLKSLQSAEGKVFAAVKTSLSASNAPLIMLLERNNSTGDWKSYVFGRKTDHHTRPVVMIDDEQNVVHMFATAGESGGTIYEKTAPLNNISFPTGLGTPVIRDADNLKMNNPTSTKQNVNSSTGLVVLATNATTQRYWHHYDPLGGSPPPPPPPPGNTAPSATPAAAQTTADVPVTITLAGSDAETCDLTFAVVAAPAHGSLAGLSNRACAAGTPNTDSATISYTPAAGYTGADSFTFKVTDGGGLSSPGATISITVNSAPPPGGGISFVASSSGSNATATSLTIPAPSGVSSGDVLLAAVDVRGGPAITAPAGWTLVRLDANGFVVRQAVYVKVAGASEPGSYTWTFASSQAAAGGISAFAGVDTANPIDAHGGQVNASSKTMTAPSITTTAANAMLVGLFGTAPATTVTPPSGMTERWEAVSSAGTYKATSESATALQAAAGPSGTRTATSAVAGANVGQLVALRPA